MVKFIAELCQNHLGKKDVIIKMIDQCAENGADIIKLQNIFASDLAYRYEFEKGLNDNNKIIWIKRPYLNEYKRLKKLELDYKFLEKFINICNQYKVTPSITCFSRYRVNDLKNLGFKTIKVASYDCASFPFIQDLSKNFNELIVSTGATFDDEIVKTVKILKKNKIFFSLLHCVTIYPTPLNQLNLSRMNFLKKFTSSVGFSDHSLSTNKNYNLASKIAIYYGAKIIERHIRFFDHNKSKDGKVSILSKDIKEIKEFSKLSKEKQKDILVNHKYNFKKAKGKMLRDLSHEELVNRLYYRGRFANIKKKRIIYNWEDVDL